MKKSLAIFLALVSSATVAVAETVLVTMVRDNVTMEGTGTPKVALEPFVRLNEGDRLTLPAKGQVSMVFVGKGRQETWLGSGVVQIGEGEGKVVSGKPEVQVKQIPPEVARQMNRTPSVAADGRVGMMRLRGIRSPDAVARLDGEYRDLRTKAAADDITPEIYLLAGLFDLRQYDRVDQELKRITQAFAQDPAMPGLLQLYTRALAGAKQPGQ